MVKVIEATSTSIDFEILYTNPLVVSRFPQEQPDQIELTFERSIFKDPISNFDVNDGKPFLVDLPR